MIFFINDIYTFFYVFLCVSTSVCVLTYTFLVHVHAYERRFFLLLHSKIDSFCLTVDTILWFSAVFMLTKFTEVEFFSLVNFLARRFSDM